MGLNNIPEYNNETSTNLENSFSKLEKTESTSEQYRNIEKLFSGLNGEKLISFLEIINSKIHKDKQIQKKGNFLETLNKIT